MQPLIFIYQRSGEGDGGSVGSRSHWLGKMKFVVCPLFLAINRCVVQRPSPYQNPPQAAIAPHQLSGLRFVGLDPQSSRRHAQTLRQPSLFQSPPCVSSNLRWPKWESARPGSSVSDRATKRPSCPAAAGPAKQRIHAPGHRRNPRPGEFLGTPSIAPDNVFCPAVFEGLGKQQVQAAYACRGT